MINTGHQHKHITISHIQLLSRVSVRGTLTDAHNEITCTQVEALNSTPWSYMCVVVDDCSLEDGNGVERIDQGSSASYR